VVKQWARTISFSEVLEKTYIYVRTGRIVDNHCLNFLLIMYKSLKTLNNFKQWHQTISYFKNKQTLASIVKYKKMMETLKQIFGNLIKLK
jgi:hypothetical protein